jgi:hypothetical protein
MGHMLGFVVIVILYATIGFLAAAGAIVIARKVFATKAEQIFYAMFLIMIAALYLAFTATWEWRRRGGWRRLLLWRLPRWASRVRACPSP